MLSIFKRRQRALPDLSALISDMHSHLLPGIDDGSPDPHTSLLLIKGLEELGFKHLITTPHIFWDLYKNNDRTISDAYNYLVASASSLERKLPVQAAAEYMIDDHFTSLLNDKVPLRTLSGNYVLVEFPFVSLPFDWKTVFFDLQIQGYQPVLAHPERYNYLAAHPEIFQQISEMGVLLQVNLNSLTGYYGKPALQLAQYLTKHKLVSFLGTDLHHQRHLDALRQSSHLAENIKPILDSGKLLNSSLI